MRQFTITQVTDDIHKINEPFYRECANLFLINGDDFELLIDTGVGLYNVKKFLKSYTSKPIKVLLTHCHFDHVGGIRHFSGDDILATEQTIENLQQSELWALDFLDPADFMGVINAQEWCQNFTTVLPQEDIQLVSDYIEVGNYQFKIISTPGHTNDSVSLYDERHKLLISGDALYDGALLADFKNSHKSDYVSTLQMLQKLDFDAVLPGHNQILDKGTADAVIHSWIQQLT